MGTKGALPRQRAGWDILLIGGPSGSGKTVVARRMGLRFGLPWLQVDDLRLALQYSQVDVGGGSPALQFFLRTNDVWKLPAEELCDRLIDVGQAMSPAIEIVIAHHIATSLPVVIEGDGILPSLLSRTALKDHFAAGRLRALFLVERDEAHLRANMMARGRHVARQTEDVLEVQARMNRLYGEWLYREALRQRLPVIEPRPWPTLVERVISALDAQLRP